MYQEMTEAQRLQAMKMSVNSMFDDQVRLVEAFKEGPSTFYKMLAESPVETTAQVAATLGFIAQVGESIKKAGDKEAMDHLMEAIHSMAGGLIHRVSLARVGCHSPSREDLELLCKAAMSAAEDHPE